MIIDMILDRKDGCGYSPERARDYIMAEEECFGWEPNISRAIEAGDEIGAKAGLCDYIVSNGYNPGICGYIWSEKWSGGVK